MERAQRVNEIVFETRKKSRKCVIKNNRVKNEAETKQKTINSRNPNGRNEGAVVGTTLKKKKSGKCP
jgi:hypothetical protein